VKNRVPATGRKGWSSVKSALRVALGYPKAPKSRTERREDPLPSSRSQCHPQDPSCCRSKITVPPDLCPKPVAVCDIRDPRNPDPSDLFHYLSRRGNHVDDISKANTILRMPQVLLEVGCGSGEAARLIALANPGMGVIATDLYDCGCTPANGSYYGKIARLWCARQLPAQQEAPPNLVFLRAEADLLHCLPVAALDSILLINPEPQVGQAFIQLLQEAEIAAKIKPGPNQIIILPYSRELGVMASGGFSFEHDPDWSRGLGYIMGSDLPFRRGLPVQWGVDLLRVSAYTGNSTQRDIFIFGDTPN
jgi:SAM-dependent methyltransferase